MSYRQFTDELGRSWEAWEVHPASVERRLNGDRRVESRPGGERRQETDFRLMMPAELKLGWLALQRHDEKVRVAPIPEGWFHLSDRQLTELLRRAERLTLLDRTPACRL